MATSNRRRVVEVFVGEPDIEGPLLDRVLRLPLRDCIVQVRSPTSGGPGMVVIDGRPVVSDEPDGRLSSRILRDAVLLDR